MASTINATTSGVVTTGDSVATLSLQTGGTTAVAIDSAQIVSLSKSLALLGSSSGSVSIAAPATAGTQSYTLPTAQPTADGLALTSTKVGAMSWAAPTATAAGSDTQVQYNNGGTAFGAASTFTFNNSTGVVSATGFSGAVNGTVGATTPAAGTFTTATARAAATQDSVVLQGRAGGTSSYAVTITPTTLTGNKTLTLPDATGTILQSGTAVTVAQGGTGLTAGTSGGVPYYSGTSAITSSALLTQYGVVYGGGAGNAPVATAAGTTGQFLGANTGAAPTWQTPSGGGSPGGSPTQVQYNNAGAFGGVSGFTTDGTRVTASTTIGVGGATPSTSGSGVTFPATASASSNANTLDDYEESTWTPAISTGGGSYTYTTQIGNYTIIGRLVYINARIVIATASGSPNFLTITLPIASARTDNRGSFSVFTDALVAASTTAWEAEIRPTAPDVRLYACTVTSANGNPAAYLQAGSIIVFSGFYETV